jgi:tetratricopeptide (TPR) repeat protein
VAHTNLGNALRAKGQPHEAITAYRKAIELNPGDAEAHCNLGDALRDQGQCADALAALRRGHELGRQRPSWRYQSGQWVRHAERLVELDRKLPAVLAGEARPADADEGLLLADLCRQYKLRYAAAARLAAAAFRRGPALAEDLTATHRYNAACAAALAAANRGTDSADLDEKEQSRLRRQALAWLRADLAAWARVSAKSAPEARQEVRGTLAHWREDPDLGGLRDKAELVRLPDAERRACRELWAEVDAVLTREGPAR